MAKNNILKLKLSIPPSINNNYMKPRAFMNKGRPMAMMYESKVAKDFKKYMIKIIKEEVIKQNFKPIMGKFTRLEWTWYFGRVNSDTNNVIKVPIDSVTESGIIWEDDNISVNTDVRIYYDSKNPRVEIELFYEDWIGIFDTEEIYNNFLENNCNKCSRGIKGNCSIHKKAIESRIQEEINMDTLICSKLKPKK